MSTVVAPSAAAPGVRSRSDQFWSLAQTLAPIVGLIGLFIYFSVSSEYFLDSFNLQNIITDNATLLICAAGMTLVILIAEIDLSVGALTSLLGIALAKALEGGLTWPVAVVLTVALGGLIGILSGSITVAGRIPSFITTLGIAGVATGLTYITTESIAVSILDVDFLDIFYTRTWLGLPIPFFLIAAVYMAIGVLMRFTVFGRNLFAIGGNRRAARMTGISVGRSTIIVFAIMGLAIGLGAVLVAARLGSGTPDATPTLTLDVIAAVIIGGASLNGGRAALWRTLVGGLLIAVLNNGLILMNVNSYYQYVIKGVIILVAVLLDRSQRSTDS
jgi:ribose transport system permease protein